MRTFDNNISIILYTEDMQFQSKNKFEYVQSKIRYIFKPGRREAATGSYCRLYKGHAYNFQSPTDHICMFLLSVINTNAQYIKSYILF